MQAETRIDPTIEPVLRVCRAAERAIGWKMSIRFVIHSVGVGAFAAAWSVGGARLYGFERYPGQLALWLGLCAFIGGIFGYGKSKRGVAATALALDQALGLKERLSTAVAVAGDGSAGTGFAPAIIRDAARLAGEIDPRIISKWELRGALIRLVLGMALLVLIYLFMPQMDLRGRLAAKEAAKAKVAARAEESRKLEELAKSLEAKEAAQAGLPENQKLPQDLNALAEALKNPATSETEAALKLSDMRQKLEEQRAELAKEAPRPDPSVLKNLESEEAKELARDLLENRMGEAAEDAAGMRERSENGGTSTENAQKLARDLDKLAEALKQHPELAKQMMEAAKDLAGKTPQAATGLKNLEGLLDKLAKDSQARSDLEKASKALSDAQKSIAQAGEKSSGEKKESGASAGDKKSGSESKPGAQKGSKPAPKQGESVDKPEGSKSYPRKDNKASQGAAGESESKKQGEQKDAAGQEGSEGEGKEGEGKKPGGQSESQSGAGQSESSEEGNGAAGTAAGGEAKKPGSEGSQPGEGSKPGMGHTWNSGGPSEMKKSGEEANRQSDAERRRAEEEFMRQQGAMSDKTSALDVRVRGRVGEGQNAAERLVPATPGDEKATGDAQTSLAETGAREKQSLDRQTIPLEYKNAVRRYFDALEARAPTAGNPTQGAPR